MEEILSNLNFDEGMEIPIANLENKKLESKVCIYFVFIVDISKDFKFNPNHQPFFKVRKT